MTSSIDFHIATSEQIERDLGARLEALRLSRNLTQQTLASDAGISVSTLKRLERGDTTTLNSFIRVIIALRLQDHMASLLPDPGLRPVERVARKGRERRRARPVAPVNPPEPWSWGEEDEV
ncbi:MAG TPA: helix-turn-helix transcriptional regulator [Phenylobacterium sp.]|jgi:transcriptional regulator with XRE-family HTH domain|nr:helix-turn-helix transcriptional regulator [Phenylobacterium sp.]